MSTPRFFVPPALFVTGTARLPEGAAAQIRRVLRLKPGDGVTVFDGSGAEWPATLDRVDRDAVTATLGEAAFPAVEPRLRVTLIMAVVRPERMELAFEKCTELGAHSFVLCVTERTQGGHAAAATRSRLERWQRIVTEASEQSARVTVPRIEAPQPLQAAVEAAAARGPVVVLWEQETAPLRQVLRDAISNTRPTDLALVVGPVGGLSPEEVEAARRAGAQTAGMGPRLLRTETAAMVALTAALYEASELGG